MLKSHEKFHSSNGKRQILVADDEWINREILGGILKNDYEILYAADGQETLECIRSYQTTLSLILLDLMMPGISGMEVLRQVKEDPALSRIPIIVMTSDQDAEIESLTIGAIDFIPKPYPQPGVILARVLRTIELSEDRQIIQSTERDPLTGLYNREYFYRYAEQFDQHHKDMPMDCIVVDVNHFHMINERFGTAYGDEVLRRIGEKVREMVSDTGGIVCRREADTFLVYCPHGKNYKAILDSAAIGLAGDTSVNNRVRLRMGVYENADKSLDIERRFDRAKSAADTVRNSFTKTISIYDETLHQRELYAEQLIEDFHSAIEQRQFAVYYQPKFDVRPEIPVLASAEALVRWKHPRFGMISPGVFIPLFEENGLIQELDYYVWRTAAAQIRDWKDRLGLSVPVSVNVSRIDMYDPNLIETLKAILEENGLSSSDILLEITESAYTQDSEQIIEIVNHLRMLGFRIEMDDFGTGYSSLNMISTLPIDALKLDMQFIRNAFSDRKDTRLLEVILDIADYLAVPVIAEGVETEEQLNALKTMGCDLVQGYYFSRPVPPEEYEQFIEQRKRMLLTELKPDARPSRMREQGFGKIAYALSRGFESIYYVDIETNHYVEFGADGRYENLQIERSGADFFADTQQNLMRVVYGADQQRVALLLQKETLLSQLIGTQPFIMTYRLLIDGKPMYYSLKAVKASTHDDHHIVIGVSNVDQQVRQTQAEPIRNPLDFGSLAQSLSADLESLYYVDIETGNYMEFTAHGPYEQLELQLDGKDFFGDCQRNIPKVIYSEDRLHVSEALSREKLLMTLQTQRICALIYRLVIADKPVYYRLKAAYAEGTDNRHLVIGVCNIDGQTTDEQHSESLRRNKLIFEQIAQALLQDYFSIYYVDLKTDRFIEYSSQGAFHSLNLETNGEDFFKLSRNNIRRVGHPEDLENFLAAFTKENILNAMQSRGVFTLTYRLMLENGPTYVHLKATPMEDDHIVIGVSNVDAQMRREQELNKARQLANRDALTGVKSKYAFTEAEKQWNERIAADDAIGIGIAVCDVNGLKQINDTLGHKAGDSYLKAACRMICEIFRHSPVYRVGGDEFVIILTGRDYENRENLLARFDELNHGNPDHISIACGIAERIPEQDKTIESIFERADARMYENKKNLKGDEN